MKKIEWNKVTWYSRSLAVIIFLATFYAAFNLGRGYQALEDQDIDISTHHSSTDHITDRSFAREAVLLADPLVNEVVFTCSAQKTIHAQVYKNNVELKLSDGRHLLVPHAISADGARYANSNESFIFWMRGQGAFIEEGVGATTLVETYKNCIITK